MPTEAERSCRKSVQKPCDAFGQKITYFLHSEGYLCKKHLECLLWRADKQWPDGFWEQNPHLSRKKHSPIPASGSHRILAALAVNITTDFWQPPDPRTIYESYSRIIWLVFYQTKHFEFILGLHHPWLFQLTYQTEIPGHGNTIVVSEGDQKEGENPFLKEKSFTAGHREKACLAPLRNLTYIQTTWPGKAGSFICCTSPGIRLNTKRWDFRSLANVLAVSALFAMCA